MCTCVKITGYKSRAQLIVGTVLYIFFSALIPDFLGPVQLRHACEVQRRDIDTRDGSCCLGWHDNFGGDQTGDK